MGAPPTLWRTKIIHSIAKSRKIKGGNYIQLATVDKQSLEPRCRTVVFRGFLPTHQNESADESCVMTMITDSRSCKVTEVGLEQSLSNGAMENNTAEVVWWFSQSSEQYRIRGRLVFVGEDCTNDYLRRARKERWGNLSDLAREQFFWRDPGTSYETQVQGPTRGRDSDGKLLPPPRTFLLMLLYPSRCDYLRLSDNYRQIDTLQKNTNPMEGSSDAWTAERVNP